MATEIFMPKMSNNMETGTIIEIHVRDGQKVKKDETVFVIETDKAIADIVSPKNGTIKLAEGIHKGAEIPISSVLAYVFEENEKISETRGNNFLNSVVKTKTNLLDAGKPKNRATTEPLEARPKIQSLSHKILATPVARKIAEKKGIAIKDVNGSGPNGRIRRIDVEQYISNFQLKTTDRERNQNRDQNTVIFNRVHAISAKRITNSWNEAPHIFLNIDINMEKALSTKGILDTRLRFEKNYKLSITALIIKTVADLLGKYPKLNASYTGQGYHVSPYVNIGFAVSSARGLVVPVIKQANEKPLSLINDEILNLTAKERMGKSEIEDISGGTFTVSNLGMFGIKSFSSILNYGQSAILAIGAIIDTPAVVNGIVCVKPMMSMTLSIDHRCADGSDGASFLVDLKHSLEDY